MERGFKSRCEEMSLSMRAELGLKTTDPLAVNDLASYLGVLVWSVTQIEGLSLADIRQLVEVDADSLVCHHRIGIWSRGYNLQPWALRRTLFKRCHA